MFNPLLNLFTSQSRVRGTEGDRFGWPLGAGPIFIEIGLLFALLKDLAPVETLLFTLLQILQDALVRQLPQIYWWRKGNALRSLQNWVPRSLEFRQD